MSASKSRLAYPDCFDAFEKALNTPNGIRIKRSSYNKAYNLRSRLNYARAVEKEENREIYEIGDPLYGKTQYDPLLVTVESVNKVWYVVIRNVGNIKYAVEELSENLEGVEETEIEKEGVDELETLRRV